MDISLIQASLCEVK